MKPKRLSIKGLNSFIEEQVIDFEALTSKGLFGIFGPTGSGKSTILDAITYVLYGDIARDSNEFMNTLCNSLYIVYEFDIGLGEDRKTYIVERGVNKDKNGAYKLKTCKLIEKNLVELTPVAEGARDVKDKIEEIIGLKAEDFQRSVVLPQGKFNEFLKLTGAQRRDMLERIFNLEKYGRALGDKIKRVKRDKQEKLNIIKAKMESFKDRGVSEEVYNELKKEIEELTSEDKKLRCEKENLDREYDKLKNLWELQKELINYEETRKELASKDEKIKYMKEKSEKGRKALSIKPLIDELEEIDKKLISNGELLNTLTKELNSVTTLFEELNTQHKEALEMKDKLLPELIDKESKLERAIKIDEELKVLSKEREELAVNYKKFHIESEGIKQNIDKLIKQVGILEEDKLNIEKTLEEVKVSPEHREKVFKASMLKKELKKQLNNIEESKIKIEKKKVYIGELENKFKALCNEYNIKNKEIEELNCRLKELEGDCPGNNDTIIEKDKQITFINIALKQLDYIEKDNQSIREKIKVYNEQKNNLEHSKDLLEKENEDLLIACNQLKDEINNIEKINMAAILSKGLAEGEPCPVCGALHHIKLADYLEEEKIHSKNEELVSIESKFKDNESKIKQLEKEILSGNTMKEVCEKKLEDNIHKISETNIEGIDIINTTYKELVTIYENKNMELEEIKKAIEIWKNNKEKLETKINQEIELRFNLEKEKDKTFDVINIENSRLDEMSKEKQDILNDKDEKQKELQLLIEELSIEDIDKVSEDIRKKDEMGNKLEKKLKETVNSIESYKEDKQVLLDKINDLEIKKAKVEETGKEKRSLIDKYTLEKKELCENREPQEYLEQVKKHKQNIIDKELMLREKLEQYKDKKQNLSEEVLRLKQDDLNLSSLKNKREDELSKAIYNYGFINREDAIKWVQAEQDIDSMEKEVKLYEEQLNNAILNISRINDKLNGQCVNEEQWEQVKQRKEIVEGILEANIKKMAEKNQSICNMERDLKDLKLLSKECKEMEHICSNLDDISKLIEGNKFVEFVAQNQLKYICIEASKKLKDISRGRYALEIDDSGNFIMRDDFNGGTRRPTNTLSGGETFLTSLALALALSSQIQLKGNAPLEFFFLDEGFGTLDNDLLETVIGSLERLHSERLCVGLISHVEELKNRVPIKLIVDSGDKDGTGSKVKIELT